jgi:hypothetical protein
LPHIPQWDGIAQWLYDTVKGIAEPKVIAIALAVFVIGWGRLRATKRLLARFEFNDRRLGGIRAWLATLWALRNPLKAKDLYQQMRLRVERHLLSHDDHQYEDARTLSVETVGEIYHRRHRLARYLREVAPQQHPRLLSTIRVEGGFVAPHHLLAGLLAAFNENWGPLIEAYRQAEFPSNDPLGPWRQPQASMFLMWLIWGPSIPICTCGRWRDGALVLQYGYGDESNSIPLLVSEKWRDEVIKKLTEDGPGRPLALRWSVAGTLTFGTQGYAKGDAERAIAGEGRLCDAQKRLAKELVLEYDETREHDRTRTAPRYYTAYVWVMFRICDKAGNPLLPPGKDARLAEWPNLLPFFEHANIADRTAYEAAKRQLAMKVLPTLKRIVEEAKTSDEKIDVHFKYACAIDDAMCHEGTLAFPIGGDRIRDLLKQALSDDVTYVDLDHKPDRNFSACHLPEIIGRFCDAMTELGTPLKTKGAASGSRRRFGRLARSLAVLFGNERRPRRT